MVPGGRSPLSHSNNAGSSGTHPPSPKKRKKSALKTKPNVPEKQKSVKRTIKEPWYNSIAAALLQDIDLTSLKASVPQDRETRANLYSLAFKHLASAKDEQAKDRAHSIDYKDCLATSFQDKLRDIQRTEQQNGAASDEGEDDEYDEE
ncbi:hypothetical protein CPB97_000755 [Podila verticillata]|nr:hypothetical protein CPB97_000755 [Podila verticillata]